MGYSLYISIFICSVVAAASDIESPLQLLSNGNQQFAAAVYKELLKSNSGNIVFSPFSAETVLALTSDGAKGDTRTELLAGLRLPESQEKIQQGFKEILPKLKINNDNVKLLSANKIYVDDTVILEEDFKKIAVEIYDSGIENIDFEKNVDAANTINKWVEDQTNNRIQDLIDPVQIGGDTALVLVNAIYLNAKWFNPFKDRFTTNEKFYKTATDTIEVPLMYQREHLRYFDNKELNAQFLELRYRQKGLNMIFILPNEKEGLTALENNIEKVFEPQRLSLEDVDVKLPKFVINTKVAFVDILKSLGVKKIFNNADLTGLAVNRKNLFVSDVVQKAFINVTESGTEAAAATAVLVESRSGRIFHGEPKKFHADHPFIYLIKFDDIILFAGRFNP